MDLTPKELFVGGKPIAIKGLLPSQKQVNQAMQYLYEQGIIKTKSGVDFIQCFENFVVVGDSVSCGFTATLDQSIIIDSATAKERKMNWVEFVSKDIGRDFTNLAIGGTTVKDWRNSHVTSAKDIDTDCYIVFLGINDDINQLTVGTNADITSDYTTNPDTFYGNLDFVVRTLLSYNPKAKLFLLTNPMQSTTKAPYNEAVRYVGTHTDNVYLIDLETIYASDFAVGGFMYNNKVAVHSTTLGYRKLANMIRESINDFMEEHYNYFDGIPYVSDSN